MKTPILFLFLILIVGCQKSFTEELVDKIDKKMKSSDTSVIRLGDFTDFSWDTLYLFKPCAHLEEIEQTLGFDYMYFEDVADRIIFTKSKEIIYHQDNFPYPEEKPDGKVFFEYDSDTSCKMIFSQRNAIFKAIRVKAFNHVFFELIPVSHESKNKFDESFN